MIRADSDPVRQALFTNLVQARPPVRIAYAIHQWLGKGWGSALLVSCYGLVSFLTIGPSRPGPVRVLAVATHENAQREVTRIVSWLGPSECGWVRTGIRTLLGGFGLSGLALLVSRGRIGKTLRILRSMDVRYGFLVACRVAGAIAWYSRSKAILHARNVGVVLVSSDSNPEELGLVGAARALRVPQVFVAHAYPTPFSPPLDFSLSILEGEAAVRARSQKAPIKGQVLLVGIDGESAPLDVRRFEKKGPAIGIFTPKAISWPTLLAVIDDCRQCFQPKRIIIRWHPSMLEPPRLAHLLGDLSGVIESSRAASLSEVAQQCDWVIADENSNVHLPVLKLGIPTVAIRNLGLYPASRSDLYGFVANRIVYPPVKSLREIEPNGFAAFFSDSWASRFQQYDVSYLRPQDAIGLQVRRAVSALLVEAASNVS